MVGTRYMINSVKSAFGRWQRAVGLVSDDNTTFVDRQSVVENHAAWVARFDKPDAQSLRYMADTAAAVPEVTILLRFDIGSLHLVEETRRRLDRMVGLRWVAVFTFDASCEPARVRKIVKGLSGDPRIRSGLAGCDLSYVALLRGGALPRRHGARILVDALPNCPDAVLAYGDEDHIDESGTVSKPWFKPEFSPYLVKAGILLGRFVLIRTETEGQRAALAGLESPQADWPAAIKDFALSLTAAQVVHVPNIVFHDRFDVAPDGPQVVPELPADLPTVSIVIPTRDRWDLLSACLESLYRTDWPKDRLEIIVVDNGSTEIELLANLRDEQDAGRIKVIRDELPFNYSRLNNEAVRQASGSVLALLNNDTEARDPRWLKVMAAYALTPGAGAVGAKLLYPDGTVQHGGVVIGIHGFAAHAHRHIAESDPGYMGLSNITHEVSAVTGACLVITRDAYEAVSGLDEHYKISFNDVVLCLDLMAAGYTNLYVARPFFYHYESRTRGTDDTRRKRHVADLEGLDAWRRHPPLMRADRYYSPNLSVEDVYVPSFAPRRRNAWLGGKYRPPRHVLMLSVTHRAGHGVPLVVRRQAEELAAKGYRITIGGPIAATDAAYPGCERINVIDPRDVAAWSAEHGVDVIVAHTSPFFLAARWTGVFPSVVAFCHGEQPIRGLAEGTDSEAWQAQNLAMCTKVYAISEHVAQKMKVVPDAVMPFGNDDHHAVDAEAATRRDAIRAERNWTGRFVVMTAYPKHGGANDPMAIEHFLAARHALDQIDPEIGERTTFVFFSEGPIPPLAEDHTGIEIQGKLSAPQIAECFAAADACADFGRWDGYNECVGRARSVGLPVVMTDILSQRIFETLLATTPEKVARTLVSLARESQERKPRIWRWADSLPAFAEAIMALDPEPNSPKQRQVPALALGTVPQELG